MNLNILEGEVCVLHFK